ncbi:MAG: hypothetical protein GY909_08300 [Oligoflexia bacterium]|nr:hypothetical protein [Oligoflexia bacterium]
MNKDLDIPSLYQETIESLKKGHRVQHQFTDEQFQILKDFWEENSDDKSKTQQVLCLLDFSQTTSHLFSKIIEKSFKEENDEETIVFILNVFRKHEVERSQKTGNRIHGDLLMALKELLLRSKGEALEWTLRTIEELGHQSIFFKNEILSKKPSWFSCYNEHNKASRQIIELLERRWKEPF